MSESSFRVSVIVPVLDGAPFLRDAVESIRSQEPAPLEILVVDGGSTDGTDRVASDLAEEPGSELRFVPQHPTKGLGGARNVGVAQARGDVIAFLDVDDLWSADKTALQLAHLAANPEVQIVLGETHKMKCTGVADDGRRTFENWAESQLQLSMGAAMFRRDVFDRVGAFDESRPFACDWDWFMRAREQGVRMLTHKETVQYYRRHELNMTLAEEAGNRDTLKMLKTSLSRRRAEKGVATSLPSIPSAEADTTQDGGSAGARPRVSVIIPVYNAERYLAEAMDSVFAQDEESLEIIVIDDGSTDGSADVAKSYGSRVRYHWQPNRNLGVSAARNKALEFARGEYLSFLDADDIWVENKLALQFAALDEDPDLDMVFGVVQQFYSPDLSEEQRGQVRYANEVIPGYIAGTMLISREAFDRVGPFATTFRVGEFIDWYAKAKDCGLKERMLPDILLRRRIHDNNMGIRDRDHQNHYLHVLKASLNRRRRAEG